MGLLRQRFSWLLQAIVKSSSKKCTDYDVNK